MYQETRRLTKKTYRQGGTFTPANQAFPFFTIVGVAGKVVRLKKLTLTNVVTTAVGYVRIQLQRFTALPAGGTATDVNGNPVDQGAAASGVLVRQYTAQPGAGTAQTIGEKRILAQSTTAAAAGIPGETEWKFGDSDNNEEPAARGVAEAIGLTFPAAPGAGISVSWEAEWTEDGN
jgi:hypothetical protein